MPNPTEDYLYQLGGVHPSQRQTRYVVRRSDGKPMFESTMRSVAELWAFAYAPETATVEAIQ